LQEKLQWLLIGRPTNLASKRDQKQDLSANSLWLEKICQTMLLINELPHNIIGFGLIKENYISR